MFKTSKILFLVKGLHSTPGQWPGITCATMGINLAGSHQHENMKLKYRKTAYYMVANFHAWSVSISLASLSLSQSISAISADENMLLDNEVEQRNVEVNRQKYNFPIWRPICVTCRGCLRHVRYTPSKFHSVQFQDFFVCLIQWVKVLQNVSNGEC